MGAAGGGSVVGVAVTVGVGELVRVGVGDVVGLAVAVGVRVTDGVGVGVFVTTGGDVADAVAVDGGADVGVAVAAGGTSVGGLSVGGTAVGGVVAVDAGRVRVGAGVFVRAGSVAVGAGGMAVAVIRATAVGVWADEGGVGVSPAGGGTRVAVARIADGTTIGGATTPLPIGVNKRLRFQTGVITCSLIGSGRTVGPRTLSGFSSDSMLVETRHLPDWRIASWAAIMRQANIPSRMRRNNARSRRSRFRSSLSDGV